MRTAPTDERPLFVSIPTAARIVGVSAQTAHRAVEAGQWPSRIINGRRMVPSRFFDRLVEDAFDGIDGGAA